MLSTRRTLLPLALALCSPSLFAQGSDSCLTAQAIAGPGAFAFDNTAATTDGVPNAACNAAGQSDISKDVWFQWTATSSGNFNVSTCGQTTIDSKVAVYDGACNGPILACNDDSCGLQSSLDFTAANGNTYMIRVGNYPAGTQTPGTGTITISVIPPLAILDTQVNPNNGRTYHLLAPSTWVAAEARAVELGGHLTTVNDFVENEWIRSTWQNFQATQHHLWIGLNDVAVEGTYQWVDGSPVGYLNWNAGEPNDGAGGEDYTLIVKDSATGAWNDLQLPSAGYWSPVYGVVEISGTPTTNFCTGDAIGTTCLGCGNNGAAGSGCANSSFATGAALGTNGTASVSADTLTLSATSVTGPGLFFQANGLIGAVTFGDGMLCAGSGIIRMGVVFPTAGSATYPGGTTPAPIHLAGGPIAANDTKHYQCWYRDAVAFCTSGTFNLTQGVSLTWTP